MNIKNEKIKKEGGGNCEGSLHELSEINEIVA